MVVNLPKEATKTCQMLGVFVLGGNLDSVSCINYSQPLIISRFIKHNAENQCREGKNLFGSSVLHRTPTSAPLHRDRRDPKCLPKQTAEDPNKFLLFNLAGPFCQAFRLQQGKI